MRTGQILLAVGARARRRPARSAGPSSPSVAGDRLVLDLGGQLVERGPGAAVGAVAAAVGAGGEHLGDHPLEADRLAAQQVGLRVVRVDHAVEDHRHGAGEQLGGARGRWRCRS